MVFAIDNRGGRDTASNVHIEDAHFGWDRVDGNAF
ncbi:hypothetical protein RSAG8_09214, partial [Rhizoctonia solani AG-8 WAC10335]